MAREDVGAGVPHTGVHEASRRFLEPAQDVLVLCLGLALFALMARTLITLFLQLLLPVLDFREAIAQVLFVLVLVEVLRLLIVYLQEHRIAVDFMVELGIVSTLREVVLRGVVDLEWQQVVAISGLILALGLLLRFGDLRPAEGPDHEHAASPAGGADVAQAVGTPRP